MESYSNAIKYQEWTFDAKYEVRYCTRIVEWNSFNNDMRVLIMPNYDRSTIWNQLFNADEEDSGEIDIDEDLYVTIYTPYKVPNP